MTDKEVKIPPFVHDYIEKMDGEGLADFIKISAEYQKEKEDYPGKYAEQSAHLNDFNRRTGQNKTLNYEDGLKGIETRYRQRAYQTAIQHGFTGPDPNQSADKQFTKQGEKFKGMIDQARQRQQEKNQKLEAEKALEKKNIDTLKDQPSYQQSQPTVEFKGVQQEQPSDGEKQTHEQQREAFLQQVRTTREQQTQRQQDKQPKI